MNEPKIKMGDGWTWEADSDLSWGASGRDAQVDWLPTRRLVWLSRGDEAPPDVVLAVIEANAPEVLREFLAGLATPVPDGAWPIGYRWELDVSTPVSTDYVPLYAAVADMPDHAQPMADARRCAVEHRARVAADCYPELAARIAELEREVAALHDERERKFLAGLATPVPDVCGARDGRFGCQLEPGHDGSHVCPDDDLAKPVHTWPRGPRCRNFEDHNRCYLDDSHVGACVFFVPPAVEPPVEWTNADESQARADLVRPTHTRKLVEPPVEWVDGRATVGGWTILCSYGSDGWHFTTRGVRLSVSNDDCDEVTAKRGAIAVARAMGGGKEQ